jgi:hypothetical protein
MATEMTNPKQPQDWIYNAYRQYINNIERSWVEDFRKAINDNLPPQAELSELVRDELIEKYTQVLFVLQDRDTIPLFDKKVLEAKIFIIQEVLQDLKSLSTSWSKGVEPAEKVEKYKIALEVVEEYTSNNLCDWYEMCSLEKWIRWEID